MRQLGWVGGADTKRLPSWVFGLPEEHREALLWGFWDADGWEMHSKTRREGAKEAYGIESCFDYLGLLNGMLAIAH